MGSYNYGSVEVDPEKKAELFMWEEIIFGMDNIIIKDSPVWPFGRTTDFLNLQSTREGLDPRKNFPFEHTSEKR